ncbi:cysteine desulfurase [Clostridium sp. YIM B02515]|uniref:Cysteine desulfurase n=1 Tax=Clostridium rhizosphaerae TaxID=2803861 RepID=A0ABS1T8M8_9CLOT|nr:cysteine desulfurase family protein [Clostridium rhizosphaerae]MBL4935687.1 cysteine desulfurase [Clostridium rhizosphaerae]
MEIYLDNSATTKPYINVVHTVSKCMIDFYGNPSSIHSLGEKAKKYLTECREYIALTMNAKPQEIIFTSGGSESNNLLLKGFLNKGDHLITTCIEHSSLLNSAVQLQEKGIEVTYLKVDESGRINIDDLKSSMKPSTKLVSIMHVNNEIGVIEDIEAIGKAVREYNANIKLHVDAVQSYGKLKIDVNKMNIDLLSLSAHKIHGPRGVGAAYIRENTPLKALIDGGGQEFGFRSGTENLPAIAGFAQASKQIHKNIEQNYLKVYKLRNYLVQKLQNINGIKINCRTDEDFLPYIVSISTVGIRSGKVLFYLNDKEIYISKSSACSSRNLKDSHVLKAIGLRPEEIMGGLRISFSEENSFEDVDILVYHMGKCLEKLRGEAANE